MNFKIDIYGKDFIVTETNIDFQMTWSNLQICKIDKIPYNLYMKEEMESLERCQIFMMENYPELLI